MGPEWLDDVRCCQRFSGDSAWFHWFPRLRSEQTRVSTSGMSPLSQSWSGRSAMLVLMGLTGPLDCNTRRGSSQELMVSLETAPAWSCSGGLWSEPVGSLAECEGSAWDLRGSEGFTSWLRRRLFTRSLSHRAEGVWGWFWPTTCSRPRSSLRSCPPLTE